MAEASAPASSANLGPGFDCLALALGLRCRVLAERADHWSVDHGEGHQPDTDSDDAVLAAARAAVGEDTSLALKVDNDIPIGRGLGSSAAALAAGAAAALGAVGRRVDVHTVFDLVAAMEGHPDNAAAAVFGGLVLVPAEGKPLRFPIHPGIRPVLAVPQRVLLTAEARLAIPDQVATEVAVRTAARMAALIGGFLTADPNLFAAAHGDEIHESPRGRLVPEAAELLARARRAGALHAAWSGSGPSVVAIVSAESEERVVEALSGDDVRVLPLHVATSGLEFSA